MKINKAKLRRLILTVLKESRYIADDKGSVQKADQAYSAAWKKAGQFVDQHPKLSKFDMDDPVSKRQALDLGISLTPLSDHEKTALDMGAHKVKQDTIGPNSLFLSTCPKIIQALEKAGEGFNSIDNWKPQQVPNAFPDGWYSDPSTSPQEVPWVVIITIDHFANAERFLGEEEYMLEFYPGYGADGTLYLDYIAVNGGPGLHKDVAEYDLQYSDFTPDRLAEEIVTDIHMAT